MASRRRIQVPYPQVTFRAARRKDLPILLRFMRSYYRVDHLHYSARAAGATTRMLLARPRQGRIWLILDNGRPAGYMVMTYGFSIEHGGREAMLDELYVAPRHRGRGLGAAALAFLESVAQQEGLRRLDLEVAQWNNAARRLYERAGFRSREKYTLMSLRLPAASQNSTRRRRRRHRRRRARSRSHRR